MKCLLPRHRYPGKLAQDLARVEQSQQLVIASLLKTKRKYLKTVQNRTFVVLVNYKQVACIICFKQFSVYLT